MKRHRAQGTKGAEGTEGTEGTGGICAVATLTERGVRLRLHVQPRSSKNCAVGLHAGAVKVQVTAPPVEGAANDAVVAVVAKWLGVPRRAVALVQGQSSREKLVEIASPDPVELARRIEAALAGLG